MDCTGCWSQSRSEDAIFCLDGVRVLVHWVSYQTVRGEHEQEMGNMRGNPSIPKSVCCAASTVYCTYRYVCVVVYCTVVLRKPECPLLSYEKKNVRAAYVQPLRTAYHMHRRSQHVHTM